MDPNYVQQLQEKLTNLRGKLSDPQTTNNKDSLLVLSTELTIVYQKLLTLDLNSAVEKQLEAFLWNDCFKKPLSFFEKLDKSTFHFLIESGIGFYIGLIQSLSLQFDHMTGADKNSTKRLYCTTLKKPSASIPPTQAAINYITQHSLIHIGDLLRYRGRFTEALKMYDKSTCINPTNGHPYNQMGLVQLLIDNKSLDSILTGIYFYVRALGTVNPFLPAQQNLESLLNKASTVQPASQREELISSFLRWASFFILNPDVAPSTPVFAFASSHSDSSPGNEEVLSVDQLLYMVVISLFCWKREVDKALLGMQANNEDKVLELIAHLINGVSTTTVAKDNPEEDRMMSCLCILLKWVQLNPKVMSNSTFRSVLNSQPLCAITNCIAAHADKPELDSTLAYILPEEKKLFGFLPLTKGLENLRGNFIDESSDKIAIVRLGRLTTLSEFLRDRTLGLMRPDPADTRGTSFLPVPFIQPTILRPPQSASARNVALQSIFNQFGQQQENNNGSSNSRLDVSSAPPGLSKTNSNILSADSAPASGRHSVELSSFSGAPSPTPMAMASMAPSPYPAADSTNFSLLFSSIWTPNQNESSFNKNATWK